MESSDDITDDGYTTLFRQYNSALGRWLSVDPEVSQLPWQSPYIGLDNNPILLTDPLGNCTDCKEHKTPNGGTVSTPENAEVFHDVNGNVDIIKGLDKKLGDGTLFFWDQMKGGYYSVTGNRYDNPNSDWYDGPIKAITDSFKRAVLSGSTEAQQQKGQKLANLYGLPGSNENSSSYSDDIDAFADAMGYTFYSLKDGGWDEWSYTGTQVGMTVGMWQVSRGSGSGLNRFAIRTGTRALSGLTARMSKIKAYLNATKDFTLNGGWGHSREIWNFKFEWGYKHSTPGTGTIFSMKHMKNGSFSIRWDKDGVPHGSTNIRVNAQVRIHTKFPVLNSARIQRHPLWLWKKLGKK